tara:strand:- start:17732 stop:17977 length:246 start_codon:yes stop_codon:yes gene_type:complete
MALTEETKNDKIEIIDKGDWTVVQVRKATIIKKDGVEISRTFHRHIITPIQSISGEDADVQAICNATFSDTMRTAYTAANS